MDNKDLNQTASEPVQKAASNASETMEALNKLNTNFTNAQKLTASPLHIASGVLCFVAALCTLISGIHSLVNFFQFVSSWYYSYAQALPHLMLFIGNLAATGGFILFGLTLIKKETNMQLARIAPLLLTGYALCSVLFNLIWMISWGTASFIFSLLIALVYAAMWAGFAAVIWNIKPELIKKAGLAYILVPSLLLALELLSGLTRGSLFGFGSFFTLFVEYAAAITLGVIVYMTLNGFSTGNIHATSGTQNTAAEAAPQENPYVTVEPEGYLSIVKLILLSIVTLGIYVYIWIYRTAEFTGKRSAQGPQSSSGIQVVLCLFVPFYFIYWIYKQCKAIEDIRLRSIGAGSEDLSLICLLLSIFGFGIVAYALMQDQLNKVVKPSPTPAHDFYPPPAQPEQKQEEPADAQIETLKKLKELLDAGILTEEEFEAKKKQVLNL